MSSVAVGLSMARGGLALRRRINHPLPAEGRWGTALLIDGNVGMGGDVATLLARCAQLVRPGRLGHLRGSTRCSGGTKAAPLCCGAEDASSVTLPWSRVGGAALLQAAKALDLLLVEEWTAGERVFVALRSMSGRL
jgi:hypothetical protein